MTETNWFTEWQKATEKASSLQEKLTETLNLFEMTIGRREGAGEDVTRLREYIKGVQETRFE